MRLIISLFFIALLSACANNKYTVDDGRKVDEALLGNIRTYGMAERMLRPAIVRSSALKDADCDTQWELPFSVATSYDADEDDRVAWVRGLGVDERLTVVGVSADSPLKLNDKIQEIALYSNEDTEKMMLRLAKLRDEGWPFDVKLSTKKIVKVVPFKVCRGLARFAPPDSPRAQDYHWLLSVHPLEVAHANLTDDEALWLVLWGQGVSEEGGARMKTYHYGTEIVGTLYTLFSVASGIQGAAMAANAAMSAAKSAASNVASEVIKRQLIAQAKSAGLAKLRSELTDFVQGLTQQQVLSAMQQAAANRGALTGVAWVASTIFDRADTWAYNRLEKLNANPLACFSLHQKLIEQGATANSMVLDPERMQALNKVAVAHGRGGDVVAILMGMKPEELQFEIAAMPLASETTAFSYEEAVNPNVSDQPFSRGLIDGMLSMSLASTTSN